MGLVVPKVVQKLPCLDAFELRKHTGDSAAGAFDFSQCTLAMFRETFTIGALNFSWRRMGCSCFL